MKTVIVTILIYSFILALSGIYKDISNYSNGLEVVDIAVGGPFLWLYVVLCLVFVHPKSPLSKKIREYRKMKKERVTYYTDRQIDSTIKKLVKAKLNFYKSDLDIIPDAYILNTKVTQKIIDDGVYGLKELKIESPKYEWINRKYEKMIINQSEDVARILKKYLVPWSLEDTKRYSFDSSWEEKYKNKELWKIKGA